MIKPRIDAFRARRFDVPELCRVFAQLFYKL
jgi:hypothetical protein